MKLLQRHVQVTVLQAIAVVLGVIVSLDLVFSLLDELGKSAGGYTLGNSLLFVTMTTPTSVYELLPFATLVGTIAGLGVLASHHELVVMQAAGIARWRIVAAVLQSALVVMVAGLVIGEYIAPPLEQLAHSNKALQLSGTGAINPETGIWRKVDNDFIHINAIAPGGRLLFGVSRYTLAADRQLVAASFAESAEYIEDAANPYWQMRNVRQSLFAGTRISTSSRLQEHWVADLSPELLTVLLVEPDRQAISGLYRLAQFFRSQGLDSSVYFLAFWKKTLQPLATLALVVLAVSFVFGPLREATTGYRVFIAVSVGIAVTILQRLMEPVSLIYGLSPLLAALTPIVLCALAGYLLLRRVV